MNTFRLNKLEAEAMRRYHTGDYKFDKPIPEEVQREAYHFAVCHDGKAIWCIDENEFDRRLEELRKQGYKFVQDIGGLKAYTGLPRGACNIL